MSLASQAIRSAATVLLVALAACGGGGSEPEEPDEPVVPVPELQRNDPVRDWTFRLYSSSATTGITRSVVTAQDGSGTQVGGLVEKLAGFGPTALTDEELLLITETVPPMARPTARSSAPRTAGPTAYSPKPLSESSAASTSPAVPTRSAAIHRCCNARASSSAPPTPRWNTS